MRCYTGQEMQELRGYIMYPATNTSVEGGELSWAYSSENPHRWLTSEEMKAAILDAETV